jgi:hypothetical protein
VGTLAIYDYNLPWIGARAALAIAFAAVFGLGLLALAPP